MRLLSLCVLLSVAACAPSPSKPGAEPINDASAGEAGGAMASSIEAGADGYRRPPDQPAAMAMVGGTGGDGSFIPSFCLHLREGDVWADVDQDGYPSPDVRIDIACTFQRAEGEITASGVLTMGDTNPAVAGFDSSVAIDDIDVLVVGSNGKYHVAGSSSETNSGQVNGAMFSLTHHEEQDNLTEALDLDDVLYERTTENYSWDLVLDVTDFVPGSDAPAGTLDVTGSWDVSVLKPFEDIDQAAGTTVTTTNTLTMDPACATSITAGSVRATFSGSDGEATIDVTWTGCGTHSVDFTASN